MILTDLLVFNGDGSKSRCSLVRKPGGQISDPDICTRCIMINELAFQ